MRLKQLSKHFCHSDWGICKTCILNAWTTSLGAEKRWPLILFFISEKKVIRCQIMTIRWINVLSAQKYSCLNRCERARIVVVQSDSSSAVGFSDFLEDNWKTNGGVPLRFYCSVLFKWCDCDMFPKKKTIWHLLWVLRARARHGFGSSWNTQTVDFCLLKSMILHLSRCHRHVSKHCNRIFEAFLQTSRHGPFFWAIDKLYGIQREQIFLTIKCSCNIECMLVPPMPKVISISR